MPKDNKTDGTILLELLAKRDIASHVFKQVYSQKANCAKNTAAALLSREKQIIDPPELSLICSLFGFGPADFGYPADFFESEFSAAADREVFSFNYRDEGNDTYRPYMENFFRTVNKHLLSTKNSLRISDYIGKFSGIKQKEHVEYYLKEASGYFEKIEARLSETHFTYSRIFQLPLHSQIDDVRSAKQFLVETLLPATFAHLCRCLYYYESQCEFYIVPRPFRMYSYYLTDDHTIITEYNRFDKNGVPVPDMLFVNLAKNGRSNDVGSVYIKSSIGEFERMAHQNQQYRLNAYSLCTAVHELKHKREETRKSLQQEAELIKTDLQKTQPGLTEYYEKSKGLEDILLKIKNIGEQITGLETKMEIWASIATS